MKTFIALLCATVMVSSLSAEEQKPAAPAATPAPAPAAPAASILDPLSTQPLPLIPEPPVTVPKPSGQFAPEPGNPQTSFSDAKAQLKKSKEAADADDLKARIRFREVRTLALHDRKVQEQWDLAESAETGRLKQTALKQYYSLLFARMLALDSSLKPRIEKAQKETMARLGQNSKLDLNRSAHGKNW